MYKRTNDIDRNSVIEANMSQLLAASRAVSPLGSVPSQTTSGDVAMVTQGGSADTGQLSVEPKTGEESLSKSR